MHKRRSLATTLRLSLLTGAGALGWMVLGAAGASAADLPDDPGLLGTLSGVVDSAGTPVASVASSVTDPLQSVASAVVPGPDASQTLLGDLPLLPELVAHVPQLAAQPTGTVLPPVTSLVDDVVAGVPIVQSLVPAGTATHVTTPVIGLADGALGGLTEPVLGVVAPVAEAIDPVIGVVVPVAEVADPVVDVGVPGGEAIPAGVEPVPAVVDAAQNLPASAADAPSGSSGALDVQGAPGGMAAVIETNRSGTDASGVTAIKNVLQASVTAVSLDAVVLPVLSGIAPIPQVLPELPGAPFTASAGALSSMTAAGTGAPLAALGGVALLMYMLMTGRGGLPARADLPCGPSYDPGSFPD